MASRAVTRRKFLAHSAAGTVAGVCAAELAVAGQETTAPATPQQSRRKPTMKIGFHTDAFNSAFFNFEKCLQWGQENQLALYRVRRDGRRELGARPGLLAAHRHV